MLGYDEPVDYAGYMAACVVKNNGCCCSAHQRNMEQNIAAQLGSRISSLISRGARFCHDYAGRLLLYPLLYVDSVCITSHREYQQ